MGKKLHMDQAAEREATDIGAKFMHSSDVVGDMSRAYGRDLSSVRIHTDESAARGAAERGVDASLNNYVAVHYASRHMSWLHCMWGLGASIGPYIMGAALTGGMGWNSGYRAIALLQTVLTVALVLSLPLWQKRRETPGEKTSTNAPLKMKEILQAFEKAKVRLRANVSFDVTMELMLLTLK